jgi:molybdopterin/thiamine biosynthesis adenylyltransferase
MTPTVIAFALIALAGVGAVAVLTFMIRDVANVHNNIELGRSDLRCHPSAERLAEANALALSAGSPQAGFCETPFRSA